MSKRQIIKIDEEKCNGCGLCIPNCPEGALQIIDEKARLISDLMCDGLGACIGHCPNSAILIEEREAVAYDERKVMENIVRQGKNVTIAHLKHLKDHNQLEYYNQALAFVKEKGIDINIKEEPKIHKHANGCPGSKMMDFRNEGTSPLNANSNVSVASQLRQWPIQISLVPPFAPYLNDSDLLIAADCVPFAYANFHNDFLKNKTILIGCPKLDDVDAYGEKFKQIFQNNNIKSVTYVHMEVPCCFGLVSVIENAISESKKKIIYNDVVISVKGERVR